MNIRLFDIDPETRMIDINKETISLVKEFKVILKRDKDRNKAKAISEFTFIYNYCDFRSPFANYKHSDRFKESLKNSGLDTINLEKDTDLQAAIEVYKALQFTPSIGLMNELKEGLHTAQKVVKKLREDLETKLDTVDASEIKFEGDGKLKKLVDPLAVITQRLNTLMAIANELPKTLKNLNELNETVKRELADSPQLRGGVEKGVREDGATTRVEANPMNWD